MRATEIEISAGQWAYAMLERLFLVFTALQLCSRSITAVCAIRPSIKRMDCDKTKKNSAHILIPL